MKTHRTSDLAVSAFLQEQGFRLVSTDQSNGRVIFVFADPNEKAQVTVALYLNGANVCAIRFADRLRHLKAIVMRGWGR